MKRKTNKLDKEEKALLKAIENDEFVSVPDAKNIIKKIESAARQHLAKNQKINIRISEYDLEGIKRIAAEEGLPYQTLITSIIHKYIRAFDDRK